MAFAPDGRRLASVSDYATIKIWDTGTGAYLQTLKGYSGGVRSVAFAPDGRYLITDRGILHLYLGPDGLA